MATIDAWANPSSVHITNGGVVPNMLFGAGFIGLPFSYTATAALDASSNIGLVRIKRGIFYLWPSLSWISVSALGASRTLDLGHNGFTTRGASATAAVLDEWRDGTDVSSATSAVFEASAPVRYDIETDLDIVATILGGTFPAAATITGVAVVQRY